MTLYRIRSNSICSIQQHTEVVRDLAVAIVGKHMVVFGRC